MFEPLLFPADPGKTGSRSAVHARGGRAAALAFSEREPGPVVSGLSSSDGSNLSQSNTSHMEEATGAEAPRRLVSPLLLWPFYSRGSRQFLLLLGSLNRRNCSFLEGRPHAKKSLRFSPST